MLRNDVIQAALVTRTKARTNITAEVDADEIRESQWQGTEFAYPNIRIDVGTQVPAGDDQCNRSRVTFAFVIRSEEASSQEADRIAGIVNNEFHGKNFTAGDVRFSMITSTGLVSAVREDRRTWRATVNLLADVQPA